VSAGLGVFALALGVRHAAAGEWGSAALMGSPHESLPPLDRRRGLVADLTGVAARGRSGRAARLATHFLYGTLVRAHQHAAGAAGGQAAEALGRSRGGFSTKIHVRAEGGGKPMAFALSGGERHESLYVEALLAADPVRRGGRGRPRVRPGQVVGDDKGYSYRTVRDALASRGIPAVIPRRRDQRPDDRRHRPFDRAAYRERNRVERLINRLKQCRRVATRYEKRAAHCLAMLTLAAVLLWL
jgi:transposase